MMKWLIGLMMPLQPCYPPRDQNEWEYRKREREKVILLGNWDELAEYYTDQSMTKM